MNGLPRQHGLSREGSPCPSGKNWIPLAKLLKLARETIIRSQRVRLTVLPPDHGLFCIAKQGRRLAQRVKHGLEIECRSADHLEHVGGGGLLLQRFAQLTEQPRIFNGDNGLGRKALEQFDLLVGKGPNVLTVDGEDANQLIVLEHRDIEKSAEAPEIGGGHVDGFTLDIGWLSGDIDDMNGLPRLNDPAEGSSRARSSWLALPEFGKCRRHPEHYSRMRRTVLKAKENSIAGLADTHRVRQHGLEHRL